MRPLLILASLVGVACQRETQCAPNCRSCTAASTCDACKHGFVLTPSGQCAPCALHCAICDHAGPLSCDVCSTGYGLTNWSTCERCAPNCYSCVDAGAHLCDTCHAKYVRTPADLCEPCAANCLSCQQAGPHRCNSCVAYYVHTSLDTCEPCAAHCRSCEASGPHQCDVCQLGYTRTDDHVCEFNWAAAWASTAMAFGTTAVACLLCALLRRCCGPGARCFSRKKFDESLGEMIQCTEMARSQNSFSTMGHSQASLAALIQSHGTSQSLLASHQSFVVSLTTMEEKPLHHLKAPLQDMSGVVLVQGFNWESSSAGNWYGKVEEQIGNLAKWGVTDIWLPPPSQSVASEGYLPSQLYNLDDSKYGSESGLIALLERLHASGIRGVCDVVINHRCGDEQDSAGRWNVFHSGASEPGIGANLNWKGWAVVKGDPYSDGTAAHGPSGENFHAAPNIDHAHPQVQAGLSEWLWWLKEHVGFDAWRFDYAKGYAPRFVGEYIKGSHPAWAVGEFWEDLKQGRRGLEYNQNPHRQGICNWIDGTGGRSCAFDFTTKGILQEAVKNEQYWRLVDKEGKPPGLLGWWPQRAVTFIDNHDTGSTQAHWPFPKGKLLMGYAYILTHPGIPCLFWDHLIEWDEDVRRGIVALVRARKSVRVRADAAVRIERAQEGLYFASIADVLKVKLGMVMDIGGLAPPQEEWEIATCGQGYCVWVLRRAKSDEEASPVSAVPRRLSSMDGVSMLEASPRSASAPFDASPRSISSPFETSPKSVTSELSFSSRPHSASAPDALDRDTRIQVEGCLEVALSMARRLKHADECCGPEAIPNVRF